MPPKEAAPVEEAEGEVEAKETLETESGYLLVFSPEFVEQFYAAKTVKERMALLKARMNKEDDGISMLSFQEEVKKDFHYYNLLHAKSICLTTMQGAIWASVMDDVLSTLAKEKEFFDRGSPGNALNYFKAIVVDQHQKSFSADVVQMLGDYLMKTILNHWLLYQYCFQENDTQRRLFRKAVSIVNPSPLPDNGNLSNATRSLRPEEQAALEAAEAGAAEKSAQPVDADEKTFDETVADLKAQGKEDIFLDPALQELLEKKVKAAEEALDNRFEKYVEERTAM